MKKIMVICAIVFALSMPWIASIIHCEILTAKYSDEYLLDACNNNMVGRLDTLKILDYKPYSYCKAYGKTNESGNLFILIYDGYIGQPSWNAVYWDTIWSKTGNADGFVYPYIR